MKDNSVPGAGASGYKMAAGHILAACSLDANAQGRSSADCKNASGKGAASAGEGFP